MPASVIPLHSNIVLAIVPPLPFPDRDYDGVIDLGDNCRYVSNRGQYDGDRDRMGEVCDPDTRLHDYDKDRVDDRGDNCRYHFNPNQKDTDKDGRGNVCDNDRVITVPPPT